MTKIKKFAAAIAATAAVAVTSAIAFAVDFNYTYSLSAHDAVTFSSIPTEKEYMYFNTRPSLPGTVHLSVTGPGISGAASANFPSQVSVDALKFKTTPGNRYNATVSTQGYAAEGTLSVTRSDNGNLILY